MIKYLYKLICKKVKKLKPLNVLKNFQIFELFHELFFRELIKISNSACTLPTVVFPKGS